MNIIHQAAAWLQSYCKYQCTELLDPTPSIAQIPKRPKPMQRQKLQQHTSSNLKKTCKLIWKRETSSLIIFPFFSISFCSFSLTPLLCAVENNSSMKDKAVKKKLQEIILKDGTKWTTENAEGSVFSLPAWPRQEKGQSMEPNPTQNTMAARRIRLGGVRLEQGRGTPC